VCIEIVLWGAKYDANTAAPKSMLRRMRNDREAMIREVTAQLKERRARLPGHRGK